VKKTKAWFKLRPDDGSMNLPMQNLIGQVEDVVQPIIGLELPPTLRS